MRQAGAYGFISVAMTGKKKAGTQGATPKGTQVQANALRHTIAANVRVLASERGWSLAQLVDFAQVTRSALFRALRGDAAMTIDTLAKLATALGVNPAQLLMLDARLVANGRDGRTPLRRKTT